MADDFVELISLENYKEFVLPYHRRIYEAFAAGPNRFIHLCGDAARHFPVINSELKVKRFDTGFPVDFARLRNELGEDIEILGGPHAEILLNGSSEDVVRETTRILQTGIKASAK